MSTEMLRKLAANSDDACRSGSTAGSAPGQISSPTGSHGAKRRGGRPAALVRERHLKFTAKGRCGGLQSFKRYGGIVSVEQAIERSAARTHALGEFALGQFLLAHRFSELESDDALGCDGFGVAA